MIFWGCPCGLRPWVGPLRSSQVCSALRRCAPWSAAFGGPAPAPQPGGAAPAYSFIIGLGAKARGKVGKLG
ncbi:hypothetical protein SGRA_0190 [Saprospira grandis str. Lewin]|uniref:Uncharacterized protein n=1 Tax=Saprospira grandis (strain Lewin) TaxID=984262 RepID=H6L559_SAPGL|nr:hypothetical protein SGRA_0190 [Saprospira grandis str. Lewin]